MFWWGPVDPALADDIYEESGFESFFYKHAREIHNGLYPTMEVRKLMHELNMKPLKRRFFEVLVPRNFFIVYNDTKSF